MLPTHVDNRLVGWLAAAVEQATCLATSASCEGDVKCNPEPNLQEERIPSEVVLRSRMADYRSTLAGP